MINLSKKVTTLWGKKRTNDITALWLPLIAHLTDTKNVINWLFNQWLSEHQRQLLITSFSEEGAQKLVKALGFFHDIGKATPVFQTKKSYDGDTTLDDRLVEKLAKVGFHHLDQLVLASPRDSLHARAGEAILEQFGVPKSVAAIIGGHHGKPESVPPRKQLRDYTANYFQSDRDSLLQAPWHEVQAELFNYGLAIAGYQNVEEIPMVNQPQAVILEGLVIMADWLASSETIAVNHGANLPLFPLIRLDQSWADIDPQHRFQAAMSNWDVSGQWIPHHLPVGEDPYRMHWGFSARAVQLAMTKAIGTMTDPGMIIVEAPMGIGKTEIALLAAEQVAYTEGCDGVYMGLPTQATTNAMFDRVNQWLADLAKSQQDNLAVNLMHGKAQFNQAYQRLPEAANIEDTGAVVVNSWFSGKKSILTKFSVGTIDQLLLMGLKQKHLFLKHLAFSGKVVIVDEVHAYDAYMNSYLEKAVEWLGAYHVPVILLSATLPAAKRHDLLCAYAKGKWGMQPLQKPLGWERQRAYPLLTLLDGKTVKQVSKFADEQPLALSRARLDRINLTDEALVNKVVHSLKDGGVAGIIVNTVKRAQALAQLVPRDMPMMLLHSAFLATDRVKQERALQAAIGKHGKRPKRMIVIGTQVLEQSLDIDFDVLYTDIAPVDLLLQRIGRLHRHQIERPMFFQRARVYVMGINQFGDYGAANEAVYGKYLLMKTDYFLKSILELPHDISELVQTVYDSKTDAQISGIDQARNVFETSLIKEQKKAAAFQISDPNFSRRATIHGWLDRAQGDVDKDAQKAQAAVRDIRETLEVVLVKHTKQGDYLLDGRSLNAVSTQEIASQVINLPSIITPKIDRAIDTLETITSRYYPNWQNSAWLKGALAVPLDSHLSFQLGEWQLKYAATTGLSYTKEADYDK
ncbi:MAG: CRISPR-associated helicase Cas3' [Lactobacillus sp.]